MSELTAETARDAADWLASVNDLVTATKLRAEATRIEAASVTPGQVLYIAAGGRTWGGITKAKQQVYEDQAQAVIANHVGIDSVVMDRVTMAHAAEALAAIGSATDAIAIRDALEKK